MVRTSMKTTSSDSNKNHEVKETFDKLNNKKTKEQTIKENERILKYSLILNYLTND